MKALLPLALGLALWVPGVSLGQDGGDQCRAPRQGTPLDFVKPGSPADHVRSAHAAVSSGNFEGAAAHFAAAVAGFREAADVPAELDAELGLAQALARTGRIARALATIDRAQALAGTWSDPVQRASLHAVLGDTALTMGELDRAAEALGRAQQLADQTEDTRLRAAVQNSLGNLESARDRKGAAAAAYVKSAALSREAGDAVGAARAEANAVRSRVLADQTGDVEVRLATLGGQLEALPDSADKASLWLHLGRSREELAVRAGDPRGAQAVAAVTAYTESSRVAARVSDWRVASYAQGYRGGLYEREGRYEEAAHLTEQAMFAAQNARAPEAMYLWQWQLGRIREASADDAAAIDAYRAAVTTLEGLGSDASIAESARRVYFSLVDLLLVRSTLEAGAPQQALLHEARDTLEKLKTEELRDYFHDPCLAAQTQTAPDSIPGTVVLYPVLLPDRVDLIASLPDGLRLLHAPVSREELESVTREFRSLLEKRSTRQYRPRAESLYDWLIRPLEAVVDLSLIDTLVLVPDGVLRTIPIGALFDRETNQFLMQKIPVAVTPGLTLTDPRPIPREDVRLLTAALSKAVQGFPALPYVEQEVASVQGLFEGTSLVNETFVESAIDAELSSAQFGIVHIATHGKFAAESEKSFLLTFDGRLPMSRLASMVSMTQFRDEPLELLTLSACETAAGSERAALGLAGVAVRAGARSALATLWAVQDQAAAELITEFYRQLQQPGVTRARALQQAQQKLLAQPHFRHPAFWSPFLLINSWL